MALVPWHWPIKLSAHKSNAMFRQHSTTKNGKWKTTENAANVK